MSPVALIIAASLTAQAVPPVPGMCTAPASENVEKAGCYLSAEIGLGGAPATLFWHIYEFTDGREADEESKRHRWATVVVAHRRTWLYVLGDPQESVRGGVRRAVVGPLHMPEGAVQARFMEAIFPPGMRTRVHSHAGPEAFYVVEGEQCMESPSDRRKLGPGMTYIVESGPPVQAAPKGRRNLVLILAPTNAPWSSPRNDWTPSHYCDQ